MMPPLDSTRKRKMIFLNSLPFDLNLNPKLISRTSRTTATCCGGAQDRPPDLADRRVRRAPADRSRRRRPSGRGRANRGIARLESPIGAAAGCAMALSQLHDDDSVHGRVN